MKAPTEATKQSENGTAAELLQEAAEQMVRDFIEAAGWKCAAIAKAEGASCLTNRS